MKAANLALRFLLELATLAALGYWGATRPAAPVERAALAIGAPLAAALVWGTFVSPRARVVLPGAARAALGLTVLLTGAAALALRGHVRLAWIFAAVALLNAALLLLWRQDRVIPPDGR